MSTGDLTGRIVANGANELVDLMQSLRILQINIKLLVGQIKQSTELVNMGASEIATGNADLSGRTESQASSLEETASSMEELTSTVKQNAEHDPSCQPAGAVDRRDCGQVAAKWSEK